jgi:DNA-binding NarL/FixJ family response regulator
VPDIVLCDDHPVFADALAVVLAGHGYRVRAVVHTAAEIVATVRAHRPAVCVIDRHFGDGDGLALVAPAVAASPGIRVLLLTADRDPAVARRALASGASGYLSKTAGITSLVSAIGRILRGEVVVEAAPEPPVHRSSEHVEALRLASYLTARERECLALVVDGLGTGAIAERLGVSTTTVRTHVQSVLTKLGVHSRLEAASFAVRHSILRHPA